MYVLSVKRFTFYYCTLSNKIVKGVKFLAC